MGSLLNISATYNYSFQTFPAAMTQKKEAPQGNFTQAINGSINEKHDAKTSGNPTQPKASAAPAMDKRPVEIISEADWIAKNNGRLSLDPWEMDLDRRYLIALDMNSLGKNKCSGIQKTDMLGFTCLSDYLDYKIQATKAYIDELIASGKASPENVWYEELPDGALRSVFLL
jgi:hypothetical protein